MWPLVECATVYISLTTFNCLRDLFLSTDSYPLWLIIASFLTFLVRPDEEL